MITNSFWSCKIERLCASVAQGIEQRFPVPRVGGSNPSRRVTIKYGGTYEWMISGNGYLTICVIYCLV